MAAVIDCHTHRYPEEVIANPASWAADRGEYHWARLVGPRADGKASIQGWATEDQMLAAMDASGVEISILAGWYWEHQETCRWHNDWQARWVAAYPERFRAFASVQPRAGLSILDDLKRARDSGHIGLGEIFHTVQGFSMQDPVWLAAVEWAIDNSWPILMHVTEPVGHEYPGKVQAPLEEYQWLAETYPELKLILAHFGGGLPFYELNPSFKQAATNIYYDTAGAPLLYEPSVYKHVVDIVGPKKLLFGSDYPLKLYPSKANEPTFQNILDDIQASGLAAEAVQALLSGNAKRILNIN